MASANRKAKRPTKALRAAIATCSRHLRHCADLAEIAGGSAEPECGAEYIVGALHDLRAELKLLRSFARPGLY